MLPGRANTDGDLGVSWKVDGNVQEYTWEVCRDAGQALVEAPWEEALREPWLRRVFFIWDTEDDGLMHAPQGCDVGGEKEGKSCACSYLWYRLFRPKDNTSVPRRIVYFAFRPD